jgi:hypothetical protein
MNCDLSETVAKNCNWSEKYNVIVARTNLKWSLSKLEHN